MATQWQGPHYIAILAASALAFGGGYLLGGRSRAPATPIATNTSNGAEPAGIPGFGNEQGPRGRPDENELIARNAEPADGGGAAQGAGNESRAQPEERRSEPPREPRNNDKPPPSESLEDDGGYDPGER